MKRANKTYIDYFKNKGVQGINGNTSWEDLLEKSLEHTDLEYGIYTTCERFGSKTYIMLYSQKELVLTFVRDNKDVWMENECDWKMDEICKFILSYLMSSNLGKRKTKKFDKYILKK